jgi:hypothetical protein
MATKLNMAVTLKRDSALIGVLLPAMLCSMLLESVSSSRLLHHVGQEQTNRNPEEVLLELDC